MALPPGSDFGKGFFDYVLGRASDPMIGFAQTALPKPSGVPNLLGLPMTQGGGMMTGGAALPNFAPMAPYNTGTQGIMDTAMNGGKPLTAPTAAAPTTPAGNSNYSAPGGNGKFAANVLRFAPLIQQVAKETGVPERVIASIMDIECPACDPNTIRADTRATGLMQVVGGPTDPLENIRAGARLLLEKQKAWGIAPDDWGSTAAAYFGAYNGGRVTDAADATGTTGNQYVAQFNNAYSLYPDVLGGITPPTPTAAQVSSVQGASNYPTVNNSVATARPTQFDKWLTPQEQYAACGPAVAAALGGVSMRQAVDAATKVGWTTQRGMPGIAGEVRLFDQLGIKNSGYQALNMASAVQAVRSQPVVFSMSYVDDNRPGHYFLADAFDPRTNKWHVGQSGKDLRYGSEWMSLEEMSRMGPPDGMIFVETK